MKIIILDEVDSTNDYIERYIKGGEDVAVAAKAQTKGRGTKGRSFVSDEGGLYVSVLKFYYNLPADRAFSIISDTAVAVVKTLSAFGISAKIKWPNDIFVDGKKICGILTESALTGDIVDHSVIGIGINLNNDIPPELADIAVSAKRILNKQVDIKAVLFTLLYNLEQKQEVDLYARYSCVLGQSITVFKPDGSSFSAIAEEILPDGRLKLCGGEVLTSAEIKIKP